MVLSGYRDPGGPLADALLAAEAVSVRASRGVSSNPMPGLGIVDDDVERLVRQLKERSAAASRGATRDPEPHDDTRLADRARRVVREVAHEGVDAQRHRGASDAHAASGRAARLPRRRRARPQPAEARRLHPG